MTIKQFSNYLKFTLFAVCSVFTTMVLPVQAQQWNLDHFKVYKIQEQPVGLDVWIRNVFTPFFTPVSVVRYSKFLNPVDKNFEGIIDPFSHLNWYRIITEPDPARRLLINNQFGTQELVIESSEALLVPTEKSI
jgi:hypothetical protein